MPLRDQIMQALRAIPDPEMPVSIVDLGLVERIGIEVGAKAGAERWGTAAPGRSDVAEAAGAQVRIDLLPTFVGCPALDMIEREVRAGVAAIDGVGRVEVNWIFDPPWTVDRITPAGREALREHGVTTPRAGEAAAPAVARGGAATVALTVAGEARAMPVVVPCPFCGSRATRRESAFGPTRCRAIWYCDACRNSFEQMKRV